MKALLFVLSTIVIFIIFQYGFASWFPGSLYTVKTLFSLTIAILLVVTAFGIVDTLMPDNKED